MSQEISKSLLPSTYQCSKGKQKVKTWWMLVLEIQGDQQALKQAVAFWFLRLPCNIGRESPTCELKSDGKTLPWGWAKRFSLPCSSYQEGKWQFAVRSHNRRWVAGHSPQPDISTAKGILGKKDLNLLPCCDLWRTLGLRGERGNINIHARSHGSHASHIDQKNIGEECQETSSAWHVLQSQDFRTHFSLLAFSSPQPNSSRSFLLCIM